MRLESSSTAAMPQRQSVDSTMIMQRGTGGVSLNDLEKGPIGGGLDTKVFAKKTNKVNLYFLIGGIIVALVIAVGLWLAFSAVKK